MVDSRMVEMGAAEDAPEIVESLERTGVAKDTRSSNPSSWQA